MFHLNKIPKIAHYFWEGKLSYLRYISMLSFIELNPDWKVKVHISNNANLNPTWLTGEQAKLKIIDDYFLLLKESGVEIIEHDFNELGMSNRMHPVHKSDYIRWKLLGSEGGLWSDNDIIYFKPITSLIENVPENCDKDTVLCKYRSCGVHAIGFIMSRKNNAFFRTVSDAARRNYSATQYQGIGTNLLHGVNETVISGYGSKALYIDESCVYKVWAGDCEKLADDTYNLEYFSDTIGCHWYGGNPKINDIENTITKDSLPRTKSVIARMVEQIIKVGQ
jgi:hypothetical protein